MKVFNYEIKIEVLVFTVALGFLLFIAGAAAVHYRVPVIYGTFAALLPQEQKPTNVIRKEKLLQKRMEKKKKAGEI
jgi:hypothetical protein